ncbi:GNAT family N-acetyltransferase [Streptomyces hydrogenans]|uniref:GNAT family N-acetyltransferase n=1 Tax=Streptomyces hydrogenans TaxID=1873719 RepID=UPI0035D55B42
MKTRTETVHDTDRVREVVTVAFGSAEGADHVDALRADACWIPDRPLVAEDGTGTVIAHTLFARAGTGAAPVPALTPVSVAPDEDEMVLSLDAGPIPSGDMTFGEPMVDATTANQPE